VVETREETIVVPYGLRHEDKYIFNVTFTNIFSSIFNDILHGIFKNKFDIIFNIILNKMGPGVA